MTDELWMKFYKKDFGEKNFNLVIERMKKKKVAFRWKQLYEVIFSYMIFFFFVFFGYAHSLMEC